MPHCVWLVWKRLNIASNYTMKPGFLLTFLLAGSIIVHACECLQYSIQWFIRNFLFSIHSFNIYIYFLSFNFHSLHFLLSKFTFLQAKLVQVLPFHLISQRWEKKTSKIQLMHINKARSSTAHKLSHTHTRFASRKDMKTDKEPE